MFLFGFPPFAPTPNFLRGAFSKQLDARSQVNLHYPWGGRGGLRMPLPGGCQACFSLMYEGYRGEGFDVAKPLLAVGGPYYQP